MAVSILHLRQIKNAMRILLLGFFVSINPIKAQTDVTDLAGTIVIARGENAPNEDKAKASDNDVNTKWLDFAQYSFIRYQLPSAKVVNQITLTSANDAPERDPKEVTVQASNDGTNFVDLYTNYNVNFTNRFEKQTFTFSNTGAYTYYVFQFRNHTGTVFQIAEIELLSSSAGSGGSNNGTGLRGEYYNNTDFSGAAIVTKTDATVNFNWNSNAPTSGINTDNFCVRWEGQVEAPVSGSFTFTTNSDDGQRLWVNNTQIINDWNLHGPTDASGSINLTAGQKYNIKFEYYEATGGASASLSWTYPNQIKQVIPQSRLYPASGNTPPPNGGGSNANLLGINLRWSNTDWSEDRMYADVMKISRGYAQPGHGGNTSFPANTDTYGWPTQDAELVVWAGIANMHGTYKLSFDCNNPSGTSINISWIGNTVSNRTVNGSTVSYDVNVTDAGATSFLLGFVNTNGGARNIKMMRPVSPGSTTPYSAGTLFTTHIKSFINKFQVIRFMDYFHINSTNLTTWAQRALPTDASQQQRYIGGSDVGGCYEHAVQLCNETNKDMYLNIPLKADNDYITQLANLIKNGANGFSGLNSNLKVYIEYSNEVWNTAGSFKQGNDNHDLAKAEVNAGGSPLNFDGETNDWVWATRRVAKRIVEISNTFRSTFGDASMMTRIRPILMTQQGNYSHIENGLYLIDQVYGKTNQWNTTAHPVNYYLYGAGGSAYYNPDNGSAGLTINNIWTSESMDDNNWMSVARKESAYVLGFGLKRIAYEGGPSFDACNCGADAVKEQAWGDSRMKSNTVSHFDNVWSATDGDLLVYYVSTGDYQWSFTKDMYNLNTPKLQAIDQLNSQSKAMATIGNVAPTVINGNNYEVAFGNYPYNNGNAVHLKTNMYCVYFFRVTTAGTYNFSTNMNGTSKIFIDGIYKATITANGNSASYTLSNLQPGLHSVKFETGTIEAEVATISINNGAGSLREGIEEESQPYTLVNAIYPNPAQGQVNVQFNATGSKKIEIFNQIGLSVMTLTTENHNLNIDISSLSSGIYFVKINAEGGIKSSKLVIE